MNDPKEPVTLHERRTTYRKGRTACRKRRTGDPFEDIVEVAGRRQWRRPAGQNREETRTTTRGGVAEGT